MGGAEDGRRAAAVTAVAAGGWDGTVKRVWRQERQRSRGLWARGGELG